MTVLVFHSLWRELTYLLTRGMRSVVSGTQTDLIVSWIVLWGMIKVCWRDFSLHFGTCCLLCVCRKFGQRLASHYMSVKERSIVCRTVPAMFGGLKFRLSSFKKRSIVRRTVRSIFGELTVHPVKNGLTLWLKSGCILICRLLSSTTNACNNWQISSQIPFIIIIVC